jgi:uncharacterized protein (DUF1697 family)
MTRYIAFLRAINVGGHNVKMEALRAIFESMGFGQVETFIASGNVIFETGDEDPRALQGRIEARLQESLGYPVAAFLRTDAEVANIARYKPFDEEKLNSAKALNVAFLAEPLAGEAQKALAGLNTGIDEFRAHGCDVYWLCRKKQSESSFSNAVFERTMKVQSTLRGLNTLVRLAAKYPASHKGGNGHA